MTKVYDDERVQPRQNESGSEQKPAPKAVDDGQQAGYDRELDGIEQNYGKTADEPDYSKPQNDEEPLDKAGLGQAEDQASDQVGDGYTDDAGGGGLKSRLSALSGRKQKAIGGGLIGGAVVTALVFIAGIGTGPFQSIYWGQVLAKSFMGRNNEGGNSRTSKFLLYKAIGSAQLGRLGVSGNIIANRSEKRLNNNVGLESDYDTNGRLRSYKILDPAKAASTIEQLKAAGYDVSADGTRIDLPRGKGANYKTSRVISRLINSNAGYRFGLTGEISSRLLEKRGDVDFSPLKKYLRNKADTRALNQEEKDQQAEADRKYEEELNRRLGLDTEESPNSDVAKKKRELKLKLLKIGGGAAGVVLAACVASEVNDLFGDQDKENQRQILRRGMSVETIGSQIQSNQDVNVDAVRIASKPYYDEVNKTSINQSAEYQKETGKEVTGKGLDPDFYPNSNGDNKNQVFKTVDEIPAFGGTCRAINAGTNAVLTSIPGYNEATAIITKAFPQIGEYTDQLLGYLLKSIGETAGAAYGSVIFTGAKSGANQQAIAMGGIKMADSDSEAFKTALLEDRIAGMSTLERYFDVYNSDSLASQIAVTAPANTQQFASTIQSFPNTISSTFGNLFGRVFAGVKAEPSSSELYKFSDYGFTQTELADAKYENPYANGAAVIALMNDQWADNTKKCFGTDIKRDAAGIWQVEANNAEDMLQYADIDKLKSNDLNNLINSCADRNESWTKIRFFIFDSVTANSAACYEGDEEACRGVGHGNNQDSNAPPALGDGEGSAIAPSELGKNTDSLSCPANTADLGVAASQYTGGLKAEPGTLQIRLCQLSSIAGAGQNAQGGRISGGAVVNANVAPAWQSLGEKARADKVQLTASSSFRLGSSCGGGGDGKRCAKPGGSLHQLGVAIDFQAIPGLKASAQDCVSRVRADGNLWWDWLYKNAQNYGIKQYSAEAWHWDPLNAANRCGPAA